MILISFYLISVKMGADVLSAHSSLYSYASSYTSFWKKGNKRDRQTDRDFIWRKKIKKFKVFY